MRPYVLAALAAVSSALIPSTVRRHAATRLPFANSVDPFADSVDLDVADYVSDMARKKSYAGVHDDAKLISKLKGTEYSNGVSCFDQVKGLLMAIATAVCADPKLALKVEGVKNNRRSKGGGVACWDAVCGACAGPTCSLRDDFGSMFHNAGFTDKHLNDAHEQFPFGHLGVNVCTAYVLATVDHEVMAMGDYFSSLATAENMFLPECKFALEGRADWLMRSLGLENIRFFGGVEAIHPYTAWVRNYCQDIADKIPELDALVKAGEKDYYLVVKLGLGCYYAAMIEGSADVEVAISESGFKKAKKLDRLAWSTTTWTPEPVAHGVLNADDFLSCGSYPANVELSFESVSFSLPILGDGLGLALMKAHMTAKHGTPYVHRFVKTVKVLTKNLVAPAQKAGDHFFKGEVGVLGSCGCIVVSVDKDKSIVHTSRERYCGRLDVEEELDWRCEVFKLAAVDDKPGFFAPTAWPTDVGVYTTFLKTAIGKVVGDDWVQRVRAEMERRAAPPPMKKAKIVVDLKPKVDRLIARDEETSDDD